MLVPCQLIILGYGGLGLQQMLWCILWRIIITTIFSIIVLRTSLTLVTLETRGTFLATISLETLRALLTFITLETMGTFLATLYLEPPRTFSAIFSLETRGTFLATISLESHINTIFTSVSLVKISAVTSGGCPSLFTGGAIETESGFFYTFVVIWKIKWELFWSCFGSNLTEVSPR